MRKKDVGMYSRVGTIAAVIVSLAGCAGEPSAPPSRVSVDAAVQTPASVPAAGAPTEYEFVRLTLPSGDAAAGRVAFQELRCTGCHEVTGDSDLPSPTSASPGPELGPELAPQPLGNLATAIVAPSHAMSIRTSPDTREQVTGVLSPMGDYTEVMTVRQLLDILAFLESVRH